MEKLFDHLEDANQNTISLEERLEQKDIDAEVALEELQFEKTISTIETAIERTYKVDLMSHSLNTDIEGHIAMEGLCDFLGCEYEETSLSLEGFKDIMKKIMEYIKKVVKNIKKVYNKIIIKISKSLGASKEAFTKESIRLNRLAANKGVLSIIVPRPSLVDGFSYVARSARDISGYMFVAAAINLKKNSLGVPNYETLLEYSQTVLKSTTDVSKLSFDPFKFEEDIIDKTAFMSINTKDRCDLLADFCSKFEDKEIKELLPRLGKTAFMYITYVNGTKLGLRIITLDEETDEIKSVSNKDLTVDTIVVQNLNNLRKPILIKNWNFKTDNKIGSFLETYFLGTDFSKFKWGGDPDMNYTLVARRGTKTIDAIDEAIRSYDKSIDNLEKLSSDAAKHIFDKEVEKVSDNTEGVNPDNLPAVVDVNKLNPEAQSNITRGNKLLLQISTNRTKDVTNVILGSIKMVNLSLRAMQGLGLVNLTDFR